MKVVWTEQNILNAIVDSITYGDVLSKLGLKCHGANNKTLKKYLKHYNIQFTSRPYLKNIRTKSNEDIFVENSNTVRSVIRRKILQQRLIPYQCSKCNLIPMWNNSPLVLQLEHINGINNDNRLENLTFLCPNCHSQTATWAGKGRPKPKNVEIKPITIKPITIKEPYIKKSALSDTSKEEMIQMIENHSLTHIGTIYGITANAVRRWCKKQNIPLPGQGFRRLPPH